MRLFITKRSWHSLMIEIPFSIGVNASAHPACWGESCVQMSCTVGGAYFNFVLDWRSSWISACLLSESVSIIFNVTRSSDEDVLSSSTRSEKEREKKSGLWLVRKWWLILMIYYVVIVTAPSHDFCKVSSMEGVSSVSNSVMFLTIRLRLLKKCTLVFR